MSSEYAAMSKCGTDEAVLFDSLNRAIAILQMTHIVDEPTRLKLAQTLVRLTKSEPETNRRTADRERLATLAVRHVVASSAPADYEDRSL